METQEQQIVRLENALDSIEAMHARVLSWDPVDVHGAYAVLLQFAATHARAGGDGKDVVKAVDALKRYVSQLKIEVDAARDGGLDAALGTEALSYSKRGVIAAGLDLTTLNVVEGQILALKKGELVEGGGE